MKNNKEVQYGHEYRRKCGCIECVQRESNLEMDDRDKEITLLKKELQKTREQLEKAEKVIEFYGDGDNYGHISPEIATYSVIDGTDLGVGDFMLNDSVDDDRVGGKRARQYFKDKQGE